MNILNNSKKGYEINETLVNSFFQNIKIVK